MKSLYILLCCFSILSVGCRKEDCECHQDRTAQKLLAGNTEKTWIDLYRTTIGADSLPIPITAPCFTDDHWVFKADGTFEWNEGESKCNESDPYVYNRGKWALSNDAKFLEFSDVTGDPAVKPNFKYRIEELTDSKLSLRIASVELFDSTTAIEQIHVLIAK